MTKTLLDSRIAVIRALAAGLTVWCLETGEGFQNVGGSSLNHARHRARWIIEDCDERKTFYIVRGE